MLLTKTTNEHTISTLQTPNMQEHISQCRIREAADTEQQQAEEQIQTAVSVISVRDLSVQTVVANVWAATLFPVADKRSGK